jgi:hypothetical protein
MTQRVVSEQSRQQVIMNSKKYVLIVNAFSGGFTYQNRGMRLLAQIASKCVFKYIFSPEIENLKKELKENDI